MSTVRPPAALITAGAKRIGRAMSLRLARKGYDVAVHYHESRAEAEELRDQLVHLGVACKLFKADFNDTTPPLWLIKCIMNCPICGFSSMAPLLLSMENFSRAMIKTSTTMSSITFACALSAHPRRFARTISKGRSSISSTLHLSVTKLLSSPTN
ncbi:MAG: SDR family NAD(P)-dependent oxidoreductase [Candidatus Obscuribacterales bacterium]